MKKNTPNKLALRTETVKSLSIGELQHIVGGATVAGHACNQPTTTVISLDRC